MNKHLRNFMVAGAVTIGAMAVTNKIISLAAEQNSSLPVGNGSYYHWKYGNVYYTRNGHGSPLLLIHDLNASSSSYEWSKVISKLSRTHTVYALDLLGCGRSDKPNLTYTNYLFVQLINEFVRKVIGTRTCAVATGDSFSFLVMACIMEPTNFEKLVGVSPCDLFAMTQTPGRRKNAMKYVIDSPVVGTFLYHMATCRPRVSKQVNTRYFYKSHLVTDSMIDTYYKAAKTQDGHGKYLLASIQSNYTNINIIPSIQKLDKSIFLIGGRMDPLISDIIEEYITYNPSIEDAYVAGAGYLPQLESPEKFAGLLDILLG